MKLLRFPRALYERDQFGIFDDFLQFVDADEWTKLAADTTATVAIDADGVGGVVALETDATDNNEAALASTNELFKMVANAPLFCEARIKYAEANTDDANVAFGFADAFGADLLVDDGAGPKTSYSGALIYKVDGGTVWRCHSSKSTTQTDSVTAVTAGGTSYQTLRIEMVDVDGSQMEVSFYVDGVLLTDSTNNKPIKHRITYSSATEMDVGVYIKAGGANSEILNVDYIAAYQRRV